MRVAVVVRLVANCYTPFIFFAILPNRVLMWICRFRSQMNCWARMHRQSCGTKQLDAGETWMRSVLLKPRQMLPSQRPLLNMMPGIKGKFPLCLCSSCFSGKFQSTYPHCSNFMASHFTPTCVYNKQTDNEKSSSFLVAVFFVFVKSYKTI